MVNNLSGLFTSKRILYLVKYPYQGKKLSVVNIEFRKNTGYIADTIQSKSIELDSTIKQSWMGEFTASIIDFGEFIHSSRHT